jgi:hypothetical protein
MTAGRSSTRATDQQAERGRGGKVGGEARLAAGSANWDSPSYDRWEQTLKRGSFGFSARIVNCPGGKQGDIGLFFT